VKRQIRATTQVAGITVDWRTVIRRPDDEGVFRDAQIGELIEHHAD
jgi:hypothetical protein